MSNGAHLDWVLTPKLSEMSGFSEDSLDKLRQRGHVAFGVHWQKNRIGRIVWNVERFDEWQSTSESKQDQKAA